MEKRKQKQKQMKRNRMFSPMKAIMLLLLLGFAAGNAMAQYRVKPQHREQPADNGLYLDKQFKEDPTIPNGGSLFLESYVTGEVKKVLASRPTDIVLVLDRSSSMNNNMATTYTYEAMASTAYSYNGYGNHQYYYKDGEEYYRVNRTTADADTYIERLEMRYSYNSYGNNKYYYLDGGTYYQVHSVKDGRYYRLYYTKNNQTIYLSGTTTTFTAPTNVTSQTGTIWTGVLYERDSYYRLSYTKNNQTIYLSGTTTTTTPPTNVKSQTETIWTGVLYNYTQGTAVKRIDALKAAVCTFIDMIAQDAEDHPTLNQYGNPVPVDHRISIVQFDGGSQNVQVNGQTGLLNVVENQAAMKTAVNAITLGSGTRQDLGLELALQNLPTPTLPLEEYLRKNVVVLFTDGEPYGQPTSGDVDKYDVCVNAAFPLKQNPTGELGNNYKAATVYSVGTYGGNPGTNTINMMSYISSNYPNAVYMDNTGDPAPELKYSFTAESTESLQSVFELIAEESGGSTIDMGTETVIQDVISDYFQLPQDEDGNPIITGIKVYTAECTAVDEDHPGQTIGDYTYDSKGRAFGDMVRVDIVPDDQTGYHLRFSDDYTSIQVDGFDFKEEWCGLETESGTSTPHGHKLILEIPIVPKEDAWGDAMPTNGALSVISKGEDITPDNIIDYFVSPTHTVQRETWVEAVKTKPENWAADNIDSADDLAWLISVVCGYNGQTAAPQTNATITADIDMSAYNWVPIGGTEGYYIYDNEGNATFVEPTGNAGFTGVFDGGGHSITGLRNQPTKVFSPGLFGKVNGGTVKNTFVMDCDFNTGCEGYFGIIADTLCNGGTIYNCEAAGQLKSCDKETTFLNPRPDQSDPDSYTRKVDPLNIYLGGLVGLVDNCEVHSCISVAELYGYNMGGLVNETRGNNAAMENSYSYPTFYHWFPSAGGNVGGMVAVNYGKLVNCYIRERESNAEFSGGIKYALDRIDDCAPHSKALMNNGLLVGVNSGSASYLYMPATWWNADGTISQKYVGVGDEPANSGKFTITETPYMYMHKDNQVTMLSAKDGETQGLLATLNSADWKATSKAATETEYTSWFRTTADGINNDYPVLKIMDFNSVGSDDLVRLYYGNINDMMGNTSMYTSDIADDTYCIYQNAAVTTGNNDATLYINEDVAITQTTSLDAYVGITLDNSAHDANGGASQNNPNDPAQHEYGENTRDWHMFSTSLSDAPLGVNYNNDNTQWPFFYDGDDGAPDMTKYAFYDEETHDGYFPSHTYGKAEGESGYNYYTDWDYYCWSEPYNHWINFKRNSASHWAENIQTLNLGYTNEPTLTPGKGYLLAIANETFLQSHGTLNQGVVTVPLTYSRMNEMSRGFNFVGNPYQSYLNFDEFATKNPGITSYTLLDEDEGAYVTYAATASRNSKSASQFINMHQGFLVFTDGSVEEVTFTESMRDIEATTTTFRGGEKASFTLVNLILTESDGKREIVTVETGRPEQGGARKMMGLLNGKSQLYAHCDGESYSVLFATDEMHTVPVRFRTYQDDSFTLTWDVENGSLDELYLVDNITGQTVDMLTHSQYVFEGRTTDFSSRFKLVFGNGTVDEPAEGEVIEDIFAYQNEDNLMVTSEGHFEMYDMSGRLVQNVNLYNDFNTVALPRMSRGVYTLRLTNNTDTKVQKIVIR